MSLVTQFAVICIGLFPFGEEWVIRPCQGQWCANSKSAGNEEHLLENPYNSHDCYSEAELLICQITRSRIRNTDPKVPVISRPYSLDLYFLFWHWRNCKYL